MNKFVYYQELRIAYKLVSEQLRNQKGVTSVEYAIVVAGVTTVILSLVASSGPLSRIIFSIWDTVSTNILAQFN